MYQRAYRGRVRVPILYPWQPKQNHHCREFLQVLSTAHNQGQHSTTTWIEVQLYGDLAKDLDACKIHLGRNLDPSMSVVGGLLGRKAGTEINREITNKKRE